MECEYVPCVAGMVRLGTRVTVRAIEVFAVVEAARQRGHFHVGHMVVPLGDEGDDGNGFHETTRDPVRAHAVPLFVEHYARCNDGRIVWRDADTDEQFFATGCHLRLVYAAP
jgi:hypothetical protein